VSAPLLAYLREHIGDVDFAEEPVPLSGGFETAIYGFRLRGATGTYAGPLVLRLHPPFVDPARALYEKAVHDTLAAAAYPAPRVLLASAQTTALGGGFMVMERLPGRPLPADFFNLSTVLRLNVRAFGFVGRSMAQLHLRLHDVDGSHLLHALKGAGLPDTAPPFRVSMRLATFKGRLESLADRIRAADLAGLAAGVEWAIKNRPVEREQVLCHGDFHPLNILSERGELKGVIDWSLATIASPEFDVGNTRMLMTEASAASRGSVAAALARSTAKRYLSHYMKQRPLDMDTVRYYEAYRCLQSLLFAAENRIVRRTRPEVRPSPWDPPAVAGALAARFRETSGVTVSLPSSS
jgi:aminoglycoside phosphotransferase (APT) family kinase protein